MSRNVRRPKFRASLGGAEPDRMDGSFSWRPNEPLERRLPKKHKKVPLHERVRQELENERKVDPKLK
jgi:hypothetical protein